MGFSNFCLRLTVTLQRDNRSAMVLDWPDI